MSRHVFLGEFDTKGELLKPIEIEQDYSGRLEAIERVNDGQDNTLRNHAVITITTRTYRVALGNNTSNFRLVYNRLTNPIELTFDTPRLEIGKTVETLFYLDTDLEVLILKNEIQGAFELTTAPDKKLSLQGRGKRIHVYASRPTEGKYIVSVFGDLDKK